MEFLGFLSISMVLTISTIRNRWGLLLWMEFAYEEVLTSDVRGKVDWLFSLVVFLL